MSTDALDLQLYCRLEMEKRSNSWVDLSSKWLMRLERAKSSLFFKLMGAASQVMSYAKLTNL